MDNELQTPEAKSTNVNPTILNQNLNVIGNTIEFASAVITSIHSDLISDTLDGKTLQLDTIQAAVVSRMQKQLKIKD